MRLGSEHQLTLDVGEHYRVRKGSDGWQVDVVAYFYALAQHDKDVMRSGSWESLMAEQSRRDGPSAYQACASSVRVR